MDLRTSHHLGGVFGGAAQGADGAVLAVEVEGFAVARLPEDLGEPLASRASLITGPRNEPLAATVSPAELLLLVPGDTVLSPGESGENFGAVVPIRSDAVLVPAGCSAAIELVTAAALSPDMLVRFLITSPPASAGGGDGLPRLSIVARGEDLDAGPGSGSGGQVQTMLIPWPLPEAAGRFALALPALPGRGLATPTVWRFTIDLVPADSDLAGEAHAIAAGLAEAGGVRPDGGPHAALAAELRAVADPVQLRSTIAFVALEAGADVSGEAAVLLPDGSLPVLARALAAALEQASPDPALARLGWDLDRAAILAAASLHSSGGLGPEAASMLSARFGEVGRDPAGLAALARASASPDDFRRRLTAEHIVLLDDVSPATRVRAYDWLAAAGSAPPGYDPLGPVRRRREAVERFLQPAPSQP